MVRKLIKYDFKSYLRLLLPVQLILIGIAALNRLIQLFEPKTDALTAKTGAMGALVTTSSDVYHTIFISSLVLYFISIAVCLILTVIVAIVRFYQGMYTNEGYLNHTLPVTPAQHIIAKLLISFIFDLGSLLAIFLSFMVITLGDVNIEVFKAFFYLARKVYTEVGPQTTLYIIEGLVFLIIASLATYLKYYFCISIGQLASKKKVLLAFGVFFGLYVLSQILGTIVIIFVTTNFALMEELAKWIEKNPRAFAHIALCGGIVLQAVLGAVYFFISKHIMGKRLNLT